MTARSSFVILISIPLLADAALAEPACIFKDTGHRLISPTNSDDWRCMKLLAAQGDAYWQFYVGMQLIWGFNPAGGDYTAYAEKRRGNSEGIKLLQSAARSKHPSASANAMNQLSRIYQSRDYGIQDYELAYQWAFLASQQELYKGSYYFAKEFNTLISQNRQKELQGHAAELLQDR